LLICFDSSFTNSQVIITTVEIEKRVVAKVEKEKKVKERAKEAVKLKKASLLVARPLKLSEAIIHTSLLFSTQCHLQLT
jgi:hypothetical protein